MTNREWLDSLHEITIRVVASRWAIPDYMSRNLETLKVELMGIDGLQETPLRREETYTDRLLSYWKPELMKVIAAQYETHHTGTVCNDQIDMYANIEYGCFKELEFFSRGCCISQCSAAMLVEFFRGRFISEAYTFTRENMLDLTGIKITRAREGCVLLALSCLHEIASRAYYAKTKTKE